MCDSKCSLGTSCSHRPHMTRSQGTSDWICDRSRSVISLASSRSFRSPSASTRAFSSVMPLLRRTRPWDAAFGAGERGACMLEGNGGPLPLPLRRFPLTDVTEASASACRKLPQRSSSSFAANGCESETAAASAVGGPKGRTATSAASLGSAAVAAWGGCNRSKEVLTAACEDAAAQTCCTHASAQRLARTWALARISFAISCSTCNSKSGGGDGVTVPVAMAMRDAPPE
mmetsp:Transcript_65332/g.143240  ORF Transcript_65332/g.143240 Transcript_65332/m.143240 type:complete len:230 (+) Transcript_65332:1008-1697(+)